MYFLEKCTEKDTDYGFTDTAERLPAVVGMYGLPFDKPTLLLFV